MDKLIVNVALTGCVHHKNQNPDLPVTPEEVAADAKRCLDAGASMFHVHARDERGNPAWSAGRYIQYVNAVRETGAVVVASCSGRHFHSLRERSSCLLASPDMASATLGSVDFPDGSVSENGRVTVAALLDLMRGRGVKPEFEAFDLGHAHRLRELAEIGNLSPPFWVNVFLGVSLPATMHVLNLLVDALPEGTLWAGAGMGRCQWDVNRWAIGMGGHVRVGLEDALYHEKGMLATNPRMVERAVGAGQAVGREPATVGETKRMLGLEV